MKLKNAHKGIAAAILLGGIVSAVPWVSAQGIGERTLEELMLSTPQRIDRGKHVYEKNCASCHGEDGRGQTAEAAKFETPPGDLTAAAYRIGGGPIQVYNLVSLGTEGEGGHPSFGKLMMQDRWAVTHYVRSLGATDGLVDPQEVRDQAFFDAKNGVCDPEVRKGVNAKMAFKGKEQIELGSKSYAANCASCHGTAGAADGAAAAAIKPKPRDFTSSSEKWTKGTSSLAIFNSITNGVEGTAMAAFAHLPEDERWALTHAIREQWVPAGVKQEPNPEQIDAVCRSLSGSGSGQSISIEAAMKFLVEDGGLRGDLRHASYGTAYLEEVSPRQGEALFNEHCSACHGTKGVGQKQLGPFGVFPPYFTIEVDALEPASAGGDFKEFAKRSIYGAHVSLPDMTGASHIPADGWKALQAYVASFDGDGRVMKAADRVPAAAEAPPTTPAAPAAPVEKPKPEPAKPAEAAAQPTADN